MMEQDMSKFHDVIIEVEKSIQGWAPYLHFDHVQEIPVLNAWSFISL